MQNRYALLGLILSLATTAFAQDTVHTSVSADVFSRSAHFSAAPQFLQGQVVAGSPYSAEETQTTVQMAPTSPTSRQPAGSIAIRLAGPGPSTRCC